MLSGVGAVCIGTEIVAGVDGMGIIAATFFGVCNIDIIFSSSKFLIMLFLTGVAKEDISFTALLFEFGTSCCGVAMLAFDATTVVEMGENGLRTSGDCSCSQGFIDCFLEGSPATSSPLLPAGDQINAFKRSTQHYDKQFSYVFIVKDSKLPVDKKAPSTWR